MHYKNPFPVTAVASYKGNTQNSISVETKAIAMAKKTVIDAIKNHHGITISILGEYGTGKTQLAIEVIKYIEDLNDPQIHCFYLDAPSDNFLELYKSRFLRFIDKKQVITRLTECYADILYNELENDDIYKGVIEHKPEAKRCFNVIEQLGLAKSRYDKLFTQHLEKIIRGKKFLSGLLLMLQPEFVNDVWNWISGDAPTDALKERNVDFCVDTDAIALEAIGVFSYLFGQQGHRFILIIDELEKIFSATSAINEDSILAFKKLFETMADTKSVLILCGLPDFFEQLPQDAQQRISEKVITNKISAEDVIVYIKQANKYFHNSELESISPFTSDIISKIIELSNGNIRMILRICYHCARVYIKSGKEIDEAALHLVLEELYAFDDQSKNIIQEIVLSKGWIFEENKKVSNSKNKSKEIELWIPSALAQAKVLKRGIEIYFTKNVLSEEDFNVVINKIHGDAENKTLLIIEGLATNSYIEELNKKFSGVLLYRADNFKSKVSAAMEIYKSSIENESHKNHWELVNKKIDELLRMLNNKFEELTNSFVTHNEFYYYIHKNNEKDAIGFYEKPDENSPFYILITEIDRLAKSNRKKPYIQQDYDEFTMLPFIRQIIYIIYYLYEQPSKVRMLYRPKSIVDVKNIYNTLVEMLRYNKYKIEDVQDGIRNSERKLYILFDYLIEEIEYKRIGEYVELCEPERYYLSFMHNSNNCGSSYQFPELLEVLQRLSYDFCATVLLSEPYLLDNYNRVFIEMANWLERYSNFPFIENLNNTKYGERYNRRNFAETLSEYRDLVQRTIEMGSINHIDIKSIDKIFECSKCILLERRFNK